MQHASSGSERSRVSLPPHLQRRTEVSDASAAREASKNLDPGQQMTDGMPVMTSKNEASAMRKMLNIEDVAPRERSEVVPSRGSKSEQASFEDIRSGPGRLDEGSVDLASLDSEPQAIDLGGERRGHVTGMDKRKLKLVLASKGGVDKGPDLADVSDTERSQSMSELTARFGGTVAQNERQVMESVGEQLSVLATTKEQLAEELASDAPDPARLDQLYTAEEAAFDKMDEALAKVDSGVQAGMNAVLDELNLSITDIDPSMISVLLGLPSPDKFDSPEHAEKVGMIKDMLRSSQSEGDQGIDAALEQAQADPSGNLVAGSSSSKTQVSLREFVSELKVKRNGKTSYAKASNGAMRQAALDQIAKDYGLTVELGANIKDPSFSLIGEFMATGKVKSHSIEDGSKHDLKSRKALKSQIRKIDQEVLKVRSQIYGVLSGADGAIESFKGLVFDSKGNARQVRSGKRSSGLDVKALESFVDRMKASPDVDGDKLAALTEKMVLLESLKTPSRIELEHSRFNKWRERAEIMSEVAGVASGGATTLFTSVADFGVGGVKAVKTVKKMWAGVNAEKELASKQSAGGASVYDAAVAVGNHATTMGIETALRTFVHSHPEMRASLFQFLDNTFVPGAALTLLTPNQPVPNKINPASVSRYAV